MVGVTDMTEPRADQTARHADLHAAYEEAYRSRAATTFAKLGALQR